MEAVLIDTWLPDADALPTLDEASVSLARELVREKGGRLGMPEAAVAGLASATSELAHNQLRHARGGHVAVREIARDGVPGLEIVAADHGEGIADPYRALRGAGSSPSGLGVGLAAVRELTDELDVDTRLGEGTCVWARKFAERIPRRREVGVMGRAHPAERVSGDDAAFVRTPDALVFAVADGLGHGPLARDASTAAIRRFVKDAQRDEVAILDACHAALAGTRGAVMAVSRIVEGSGEVSVASVGNVTSYVCGPRASRRVGGASFVLGARGPTRQAHVERVPVDARDVIVAYTDGITSRATLDGELDLMREHPVVVAQRLIERFARPDDDVLVIAAR